MLLYRYSDDNKIEIGIDEAGRGSFWGPLMAGAVILPNIDDDESNGGCRCSNNELKELMGEIRDSKKISPKKRERLYYDIIRLIPYHGVGIVQPKEIDEKGITWANQEAFRRALNIAIDKYNKEERQGGGVGEDGESESEDNDESCENINQYRLLIDGVLSIPEYDESTNHEQNLIIEGDGKYMAIGAASILAKVEHDKWITSYCQENPGCNDKYDLLSSKGYGTKKHRDGIQTYGGHDLHRCIFIKKYLPSYSSSSRNTTVPDPGIRKKRVFNKNTIDYESKCLIKFN
jgi:ribonuclease HII